MKYKLVPLEPTPEMLCAGHAMTLPASIWYAMLEAAPSAPVEPNHWLVYLPSIQTQDIFDNQDDPGYVDWLTNYPDAEVTPLYTLPPAAAAVIAAKDAELFALRLVENNKHQQTVELREEVAKLTQEIETERMRLAACGVVAMANTPESAVEAREMHPEYMSASCQDVMRAVDTEMKLREQLAAADERIAELQQDLQTDADALGHAHLELAVKQQQINAFYSGNPKGGIVAGLQDQLAAVKMDAEQMQADFNAAINHAIDQRLDAADFLRCWREGDLEGCKEWDFEASDALRNGYMKGEEA